VLVLSPTVVRLRAPHIMKLIQKEDGMWAFMDQPEGSILWFAVFYTEEQANSASECMEKPRPDWRGRPFKFED